MVDLFSALGQAQAQKKLSNNAKMDSMALLLLLFCMCVSVCMHVCIYVLGHSLYYLCIFFKRKRIWSCVGMEVQCSEILENAGGRKGI